MGRVSKLTSCRRSMLLLMVSAAGFLTVSCENVLSALIKQDELFSKQLLGFTVTPSPSRWISGNETILFHFDEGVDTSTLVLDGTMGIDEGDINPIDWSVDSDPFDTLHLSPAAIGGLWPEGFHTLVISVDSKYGKSVEARILDFEVRYELCVDGSSTAVPPDGSVRYPFTAIQDGIDAVSAVYSPGGGTIIPVRIAAGDYSDSCTYGSSWVANLAPNVSLHGGYDSGFLATGSGETTLINTNSVGGGDYVSPASILYCGSTVTSSQVVENVSIETHGTTSTSGYHAGVHVEDSDPILRDITVLGGSVAGTGILAANIVGIVVDNGSPTIENPIIDPGTASRSTFGLYTAGTAPSPVITGTDSSIHGIKSGKGQGNAFALMLTRGGGSVTGITIEGPTSNPLPDGDFNGSAIGNYDVNGGCIYLQNSTMSITGNILAQVADFTNLCVVYEWVAGAPAAFTGNTFAFSTSSSSGNWYYDKDEAVFIDQSNYGTQIITNGADSELLMDPAGFNNTFTTQ